MHEQNQIYQYIKDGKFEDALKALFENIEENPNAVENYINAGIVLSDAGEIEKAERFFQKAITIDPSNGAVYYNLANVYYNQVRFKEAIKLYQKALKNNVATVDCNYMIGMSFNQLEAFKEALPFLMTAAEKDDNDDVEIQFQYGLVLCQLEMFEQAINQLNHVLKIDPKHVDAIYNLGLASYMKKEDVDEAIAYFEQAVSIDEQHLLSQHALKTFKTMKEEE
ncbi:MULTISPECIES: tetratricopeptide repeat protein [Staphylococcus]|uniref:Tetratricopeptide repeat protein n=1 Tax=Staphylococcus capitis TaxID=29388 RepID=A0A7Z7YXA9_STACP|nr:MULTISPECIES: tetratricopeptide repeat protein [Staphylococcus]MBC8779954.1 tetratricopeptide repeat protein [Staphylococcus capitis]MBE7321866.1 tetratricopeptide repeat protein [Staphylococcus capitis]MBU5291091.1 tetratricopeptide repeat protein [Staphylococcus capitis]MCC3690049.1 tetratricopeptide repeat protein [Staphylococcus capitis]MCC3694458.1 tetratricopeptide repeat protein [Staphylococcus capitis]